MKTVSVAAIFGCAMFATSLATVALGGVLASVCYGVELDRSVITLIAGKSVMAGGVTGVSCFLYALINSHRRIGKDC